MNVLSLVLFSCLGQAVEGTRMQDQQQKKTPGSDIRQDLNIVIFALGICSWVVNPFLLSGGGVDSPGMSGLIVFLGLGVMANGSPAWRYLFVAWLIAIIVYRIRLDRRQISHFWGDPWVEPLVRRLLPYPLSLHVARGLNVVLCFAVGSILKRYDERLGAFIKFDGFALLFIAATHMQLTNRRKIAVHNARVQAEIMQDLARNDRP